MTTTRQPNPQRACDRCTLGVMDNTNPHLWGDCRCDCHKENEQVTAIQTPNGFITSRRVAWQAADGRDVWTWRVDQDREPFDFGSVEVAQAWIDEILTGGDAAERRWLEANWQVVVVETAK